MHGKMGPPGLIIIDVQNGFDDPSWGTRNNPRAEDNIKKLLDAWRNADFPVFHVQHLSQEEGSPLAPNTAGCEFKESTRPQPGEMVIQKTVNSAFIGTDLEARLRGKGIETVVIVGLTTNHCVSTTTRMAGNLGFKAFVVADATACFDCKGHDGKHYSADEIHSISLANLHEEFASAVDTVPLLESLFPKRSMNV